MTTANERLNAMLYAEEFITMLATGKYPRTPRPVKDMAYRVIRHFPSKIEINKMNELYREKYESF